MKHGAVTMRKLCIFAVSSIVIAACGSDLAPDGSTDADADTDTDVDGDADGDADGDIENTPPEATFQATPPTGVAPLDVTFDASASTDEDGTIALYAWDFGDGSDTETGEQVVHRFETAGCFEVVLTVGDDRGGVDTARSVVVTTAAAPTIDPEITLDGLPGAGTFVARDVETGLGALTVTGTVSSPGYSAVRVVVLRDAVPQSVFDGPLCSRAAADPFEVTVQIDAVLASHALEVRLVSPGGEIPVTSVEDVVAGDVYLVQGQSNAEARMFSGDANIDQGPFVRSFGSRSENPAVTSADVAWHLAEGNAAEGPGAVGQWALHMGRVLSDAHGVPVAIINGARGGMPVTYFQRNDADPGDMTTNYGRFLFRVRTAGVDDLVRAIIYYQGESDGADAVGHHDGLVALIADWREDFPSLERVYVTQVRPGCGNPSIQLRDAQRRLADEVEGVSVMSTTGLDGHDGCHFSYTNGYEQLGNRYAALLGRDLYADDAPRNIDAPNVESLAWNADGTAITLAARDRESPITFDPGAERDFVLEGAAVTVVAGSAVGPDVTLTLSGDGRTATGLSYVGHEGAGSWVRNGAGIGLLMFHNVLIE
jgi:PKD repeat protein